MYATWQIPKIEIGLNAYYSYLTGRTWTPYQRYSSRQISYPRSAGRQPFLEAFGDRRLDNENNLDLRFEKIFKVGAGTDRISVYADVQNLFNEGTITAVNTRYPQTSIAGENVAFSSPTTITGPRRWLLGARWSF